MGRLTEDQIIQNKEIVEELIKQFAKVRRDKILKMLDGALGDEYYSAPASTRESHHCAYPGGLVEHSLHVVQNLRAVAKALAPEKYTNQTLDFVALFHDLGKIGDGVEPYYKILEGQDTAWRRSKGEFYETNKLCVHMPTQELGLYLLQKHYIDLTTDEYLAIRLHDGQYDPSNVKYSMREPDLALLVHFADRWSTAQEKLSP